MATQVEGVGRHVSTCPIRPGVTWPPGQKIVANLANLAMLAIRWPNLQSIMQVTVIAKSAPVGEGAGGHMATVHSPRHAHGWHGLRPTAIIRTSPKSHE